MKFREVVVVTNPQLRAAFHDEPAGRANSAASQRDPRGQRATDPASRRTHTHHPSLGGSARCFATDSPFARKEWMRWIDTSDWCFNNREDWVLSMERMENLYDVGSNTFRPHPIFPRPNLGRDRRTGGLPRARPWLPVPAKKLAPQVEKYVISSSSKTLWV